MLPVLCMLLTPLSHLAPVAQREVVRCLGHGRYPCGMFETDQVSGVSSSAELMLKMLAHVSCVIFHLIN